MALMSLMMVLLFNLLWIVLSVVSTAVFPKDELQVSSALPHLGAQEMKQIRSEIVGFRPIHHPALDDWTGAGRKMAAVISIVVFPEKEPYSEVSSALLHLGAQEEMKQIRSEIVGFQPIHHPALDDWTAGRKMAAVISTALFPGDELGAEEQKYYQQLKWIHSEIDGFQTIHHPLSDDWTAEITLALPQPATDIRSRQRPQG